MLELRWRALVLLLVVVVVVVVVVRNTSGMSGHVTEACNGRGCDTSLCKRKKIGLVECSDGKISV